ncbi:hypothetical protein [Methylobacterium marchantiae]|uniref:Uncharacterized protein n=1 Tax=Methylobacterium marchantiae TaxID=600331 RepID=A0ABW3X3A3_9HYPH|nr:hypothetical protein AIGOOFII_0177 [Methylobacterium marchantiae]
MDIFDSADVSNRLRIRFIIIALFIYIILFIYTIGIAIIPTIFIWILAYFISEKELNSVAQNSTDFKKAYPFRYFGVSYGNFTHVFQCNISLENAIMKRVEDDLSSKTPISRFHKIIITDVDRDLRQNESRTFKIASAGGTQRGTKVTLLLRYAEFGHMQSIQWWALAGGFVDRNKRFNFIAYAPFTIWFWLLQFIRKDYDIVSKLRTIYSSTYNDFDIETQIRSMHEVVFDSLINELDMNSIDTSMLRAQKLQLMNITISGGHVNMGNVVQGAMTNITNSVGGGKK